MEFKKDETSKTYIESQLCDEPHINVIDKETFNRRVQAVFTILHDTLKKSFGPGGAGTFISVYPSYYNTKDGFNIMKNIGWDTKLDQVISDMVMNICTKMNFSVGDGTTTAVIATKSIYDSYMSNYNFFRENHILPRDILKRLEFWKNIILNMLDEKSTPIRSNDPEELYNNIWKVVEISSNNNEEVTNMISSLYSKLMYPAISSTISKDGVTRATITTGYKIDISITDQLYINNDNNTAFINGANVIIFDHRVTKETYQKIIFPLNESSRIRGKHLICIAPYYDETALSGVIRMDLMKEYQKSKDVNLVLTVCKKATGNAKILLEDLAMLLHTTMISTSIENDIIEKINQSGDTNHIFDYFDLDNRGIPNIPVAVIAGENRLMLANYTDGLENIFRGDNLENCIRVGYCDEANIGLDESTFSGFYYDEDTYNKYLSVAQDEYEETRKKSENIGSYSFDLANKQKRLFALGLKTGVIEVGATSELSQGYLKDTVDDAVKAAASAYNNGVVLGCNVTLLQILRELKGNLISKVDRALLEIIENGFRDVYKAVLSNVFDNKFKESSDEVPGVDEYTSFITAFREATSYNGPIISREEYQKVKKDRWDDTFSTIIDISIMTGKVFNITDGEFSDSVINSTETDKKILESCVDLLQLLITGNQLVLQ